MAGFFFFDLFFQFLFSNFTLFCLVQLLIDFLFFFFQPFLFMMQCLGQKNGFTFFVSEKPYCQQVGFLIQVLLLFGQMACRSAQAFGFCLRFCKLLFFLIQFCFLRYGFRNCCRYGMMDGTAYRTGCALFQISCQKPRLRIQKHLFHAMVRGFRLSFFLKCMLILHLHL